MALEIEPELGRGAEEPREAQGGIGTYAELLAGDALDLDARHAACVGDNEGRQAKGLQEFLPQVDETDYEPHDAAYRANFPMRPCRWGMATSPSNRVRAAMGGDTSVADPEAGRRCEEIMAKALGR